MRSNQRCWECFFPAGFEHQIKLHACASGNIFIKPLICAVHQSKSELPIEASSEQQWRSHQVPERWSVNQAIDRLVGKSQQRRAKTKQPSEEREKEVVLRARRRALMMATHKPTYQDRSTLHPVSIINDRLLKPYYTLLSLTTLRFGLAGIDQAMNKWRAQPFHPNNVVLG